MNYIQLRRMLKRRGFGFVRWAKMRDSIWMCATRISAPAGERNRLTTSPDQYREVIAPTAIQAMSILCKESK